MGSCAPKAHVDEPIAKHRWRLVVGAGIGAVEASAPNRRGAEQRDKGGACVVQCAVAEGNRNLPLLECALALDALKRCMSMAGGQLVPTRTCAWTGR